MVLSDSDLRRLIKARLMAWDRPDWLPDDDQYIQPASLDFHLGASIKYARDTRSYQIDDLGWIDDTRTLPPTSWCERHLSRRGPDGEPLDSDDVFVQPLILKPGEFVLGHTLERMWLPAHIWSRSMPFDDPMACKGIVGLVSARSKWARMGLVIVSDAGFIDPGFKGQITLEISNRGPRPIRLMEGSPIGQISLFLTSSEVKRPYGSGELASRFNGQMGVVTSEGWKEPVDE